MDGLDREMLQLAGHSETVHALAFAPDGQTLFSAGRDRTIRFWDVAGGRERIKLDEHAGPVLSIAVHQLGKLLASGGADGCLKIWRLPDGTPIESYPKQMAAVTGLAWLPERAASLLMACGERMQPERGGELRLWNFTEGKKANNLHLDAQGLWSMAVADSVPVVAWGGGARSVVCWNITHQKPKSFRQNSASLAVALSPDASLMASAVDRTVKIMDLNKGHELTTLEGHKGLIRAMAFAPSGRILATGGQDQTVRFWSISNGKFQSGPVFQWPIGGVHSLAFSPDGMLAAAGGDTGLVWVWDLDS